MDEVIIVSDENDGEKHVGRKLRNRELNRSFPRAKLDVRAMPDSVPPNSVSPVIMSTGGKRTTPSPLGKDGSLASRLSPRVKPGVELSIIRPGVHALPSPSAAATAYYKERNSHSRVRSVDGSVMSSPCPSPMPSTPTLTDTEHGESDTNGYGQGKDQRQDQLQAYVTWVNAQLKKKAGVRQIEDLRNDMKDGVAIIELIEIVSGERLTGIHPCPSTYAEMTENVERILQYMAANKIRMHHTTAKDIVEGKLKSIMRLILALAAHFKPHCVKQSRSSSRSSIHVAGIVQGASAALTEARRNAAKAGNSFRRNSRPQKYNERRKTYHASSSDQYSDSDQSFGEHSKSMLSRDDGDGASADKSPLSSARLTQSVPSPATLQQHPAARGLPIAKSQSMDLVSAKDSGTELDEVGSVADTSHVEELVAEYSDVYDEMKKTKTDLLKLQDILLYGDPPDGKEDSPKEVIGGEIPEEQLAILRSQVIQLTEMQNDLREELSNTKNECMSLHGAKAGLQLRLVEQEETISQLRADLLRRDFDHQSLESDKNEMRKVLQEKDKVVLDLRKDIARRDQKLDHLQNELQLQIQEKENITRALKQQISDLHERIRMIGESGASLKARVATQDKRMAKLEGRILHSSSDRDSSVSSQGSIDDMQVLRDSIHSLRLCFKGSDPQQHTLDTLENSVMSVIDKAQPVITNHSTSSNGSLQSPYNNNVSRRLNFDSTGDVRRSPITSIPPSTGYSMSQVDGSTHNSPKSQNATKVLYFTDKTVNPCMCTVHKRLGEVTLRDIKALYDKPGTYRYSFKALDPEFGTVKEEVMNDDDIVPGWEGKIVAWIEEDT